MDTLRLDLVYALRGWRSQRGATAIAIVALALGIGATTTVFAFVSGALLKPLPYPDPDRLVMVWQDRSALGGPAREVISPGLFVDWSRRAAALEGVSAIRIWSPNLTGKDRSGLDEPERLAGAAVTGDYFHTLGISPLHGRAFGRDDDRFGAANTVILSHRLWMRRFAGDPGLIGQTITLDSQPAEVIGIMPATFRGAVVDADIWNTMRLDPGNAPRGIIMLRAIARLAPGAALEQAQAAMTTLQTQLQQEDPELLGARARLIPLHDDIVGPVKPVLLVLLGSVFMVLLIACANVASILMARATKRRAEMSVRVSLGADPWRLIRQLMTESALLAGAGGLLGLFLATFGVKTLIAMAPPAAPRLHDVEIDGVVLLFTAGIAAFSAMLAGLAPGLSVARGSVAAGLREGARETSGFSRPRGLLVMAEVAAAMTLVVGAGLFVRSLIGLQQVDLGFRPERLLTASVSPPRAAYPGTESVQNLFDRMLERAAQLPAVDGVSMTSVLPLSGMQINFNFQIAGRLPSRTPGEDPVASFRSVGPTYFETMGMRVLEGRGLNALDRDGAPMVVVVNQALVKRHWSGVSPVGSTIGINGDQAEIVGIVADVHHAGPATPPDGEVYATYNQLAARGGWLVLRTVGDPGSVASSLRAAMREIDPNLPLATMRPMSSLVENSTAQPRFLATLLLGFAAVAATLAVMGVYGLVSFSVGQRTREIGVRMALGASRGSVTTMVLGQSLKLVIGGVALGALGAIALSRVVRSMLFGIEPHDPLTVVTMAVLMVMAALVASYVPAHRAAGIDPVTALREE